MGALKEGTKQVPPLFPLNQPQSICNDVSFSKEVKQLELSAYLEILITKHYFRTKQQQLVAKKLIYWLVQHIDCFGVYSAQEKHGKQFDLSSWSQLQLCWVMYQVLKNISILWQNAFPTWLDNSRIICYRHGRLQKFFHEGTTSNCAYHFQVADDAVQMDVKKTLCAFYTSKVMPRVRATAAKIRFVVSNSQVYYDN